MPFFSKTASKLAMQSSSPETKLAPEALECPYSRLTIASRRTGFRSLRM
jgi:hypothetical protein